MQTILTIAIVAVSLLVLALTVRTLVRRARAVAAGLLAGALALPMLVAPGDVPARWQPWAPLDLDAAPNLLTSWKLLAMDGPACQRALGHSRARAEVMEDLAVSDACHIRGRVRVAGLSRASLPPVEMRCDLAARLYLWERTELQRIARETLGTDVARIAHFSSYACRRMRTARGTSGRWSQHARANAFDIAGFVLADGRQVRLVRDWETGAKGAFLHAVRDSLCGWFNVTLSPDFNALHADHFHVDMGPFLTCR